MAVSGRDVIQDAQDPVGEVSQSGAKSIRDQTLAGMKAADQGPAFTASRMTLERSETISPEQAGRVVDDMRQRFEEASRVFAPIREAAIGDELRAIHGEAARSFERLAGQATLTDSNSSKLDKERREDVGPDKSTVWGRVAAVVAEPAWEKREQDRDALGAQIEASRRNTAKEMGEVEQLMLARTMGTAPGAISPAEKLAYERVVEREPAANVAGVPVRDVAQAGEQIAGMARDLRLSERVVEKLENDASFSLKLSGIGQSRSREQERSGQEI